MGKNIGNEEFYKKILFDSPLGYAYHEIILDDNGKPCDYRFLEVNTAFEELTGLSGKDIIGKTIVEVLPGIVNDPANWISLYGEVALKNKKKTFINYSDTLKHWYNVEAFSLKKNYFITVFTNITNLNKFEEDLKYSQLLLNASLNSPRNIIILSLDKEYKYLFYNEAHRQSMRLSYNSDIEVGKCIFDYMKKEDDIKKIKINYDKALNGESHITRESYGITIIKTYETYFNPIRDIDNNIIGVSAFAMDISEIVEAERDLENEKLTAQKYLDVAGVMMLLLDRSGDIQLINKKGCNILGLVRNEIIGKNWFKNFIPKNDVKEIEEVFMNVIQKQGVEEILDYENPVIDSKGNKRDISWHNTILRDIDGNTIGVLCSGEDITETNRAIEALKVSERRFRTLFERAPFGYQSLDEDGYFLDVNEKWLQLFGYKKEEIIGKWFGDLLLDDRKNGFKERFKKFKKKGAIHSEFPMKDRSGNVIQVAFDGNILYDNSQKFVRTLCTISDMTEINIANEKLKTSEKKLSMILANVEDSIYGVDLKGNCTFVNQSFLNTMGYKEDEVIGQNIHELIHHSYPDGSHYPLSECPTRRSFEFGEDVRIEIEYLWRKNGRKIPVEYSSNPLIENDRLIGSVSTFKDISERIRYFENLKYTGYHDFLTGLNNRRYYEEALNELDTSKGYPFALLNFDVNGLKMFNDVYGHKTGDNVLKKIAKTISSVLSDDTILARVSGDEFAAVILDADRKNINEIKDKITEEVNKLYIENISLSIAVGFCIKKDDSISLEEVKKLAENNMLRDKISANSSYRSRAIQAIFNTLTDKFEEEKIHSQYVSSISVSIGKAMNFDKSQVKLLRTAALFHDIGKISIPDAVLKKPGRLTKEEFDIIKTHTEIGYRILNTTDEYSDLAKHALHHHERWDGKGYPRGLKEDEIPLVSRIICVADAYEAMTSDRVYRNKISSDEALKEVVRCAGTQFDPEIARVFVEKVFKKDWNLIKNNL